MNRLCKGTALVVLQGRVTDAVSMLNDLRDAGEEDDSLDRLHAVLTGRTATP